MAAGSSATFSPIVRRVGRPGSLTIPAVGKIFRDLRTRLKEVGLDREGVPIDVLGLDTCLMSMAEIGSEIFGETTYLVGSEGFDPNTGWPYLPAAPGAGQAGAGRPAGPRHSPEWLPISSTSLYSDYTDAKVSVDIAVCDVSEKAVKAIETAVAEFVEAFRGYEEDRLLLHAVVVAHWRAQSYKLEEYTDLADFCLLLEQECGLLKRDAWHDGSCEPGHCQPLPGHRRRCRGGRHVRTTPGPISSTRAACPFTSRGRAGSTRTTTGSRASPPRTGWDGFLERYVERTQRGVRQRGSSGDVTDRHAVSAIANRSGQQVEP